MISVSQMIRVNIHVYEICEKLLKPIKNKDNHNR